MTRLTKPVLVLIALILLGFAAPAVRAVTAVVGNNNDLSRYPFGSDPNSASSQFPDFTAGGVYQQVYTGAFTGPVTITQVHIKGAGACTITASQDGDANTNAAASVAHTFSIGKADQQITFAVLADKKFGDPDFGVSATTSSNLVVSFTASGNCTLTGSQVHLSGAGSCTINASQDGDANNNAAAQFAHTFAIAKADQQITFDALADKKLGDADFGVSATASSSLAVSFATTGNCTLTGSQVQH